MALEDDKINATDDPALAAKNGLTYWNEARGQWTAPPSEPKAEPKAVAHKATTPAKAPTTPVTPEK